MRSPRLLLATVAVFGLVVAGCASDDGATVDSGSGDAVAEDGEGAAGACLAGDENCHGDTGAEAPPPLGMCAADSPDCVDVVVPDDAVVDGPLPTGPVGESDQPEPRFVEPTDGLIDLRAVSWESVEVDEDDHAVTLRWWSGVEPCNALHDIEVEYSDDAVILTVVEGSTEEDVACIEIAEYKAHRVQLDEPVGPRSIVDGSQS